MILYTLWLFNIAMENGPFTDDFPIKTSIYEGFSKAMLNGQMVNIRCICPFYRNGFTVLSPPGRRSTVRHRQWSEHEMLLLHSPNLLSSIIRSILCLSLSLSLSLSQYICVYIYTHTYIHIYGDIYIYTHT